ncbi:MAG: RluA family pseudouridine synthase [Vicinamibacteria bacterium]
MHAGHKESFQVKDGEDRLRVDVFVSLHLDDVSRAQAKRWIEEGRVAIGGKVVRPSRLCRAGEEIEVSVPAPLPAQPLPENIPLEILYEDRHIVVVNKRPGMVVHPAPGHHSGTLVNALLAHTSDLSGIGGVRRPGIVHRLDAGTSGAIVVAKNDRAHRGLAAQFQERRVEKRYLALVHGTTPERLSIESAIGRDVRHRTRISSRTRSPREAKSEVRRIEPLPLSSLLEIRILTGRTHQIRVHLSESGYPVVGDRDYGAPGPRARAPAREADAFRLLRELGRPALHALVLGFEHPESGERLRLEAPVAGDLEELIEKLRRIRDRENNAQVDE